MRPVALSPERQKSPSYAGIRDQRWPLWGAPAPRRRASLTDVGSRDSHRGPSRERSAWRASPVRSAIGACSRCWREASETAAIFVTPGVRSESASNDHLVRLVTGWGLAKLRTRVRFPPPLPFAQPSGLPAGRLKHLTRPVGGGLARCRAGR